MSKEHSYHNFDSLLLIDWRKANEGDLTRLRINGGTDQLDSEAWTSINEEYSACFGGNRKHVQYMILLKRLAILQLDMIITDDLSIQNDIDDVKEQLQAIFKASDDEDFSLTHTLVALTDRANVLLTESTITAKYFFTMLDYYSAQNKKNGKESK